MSALEEYDAIISLCRTGIDRMERGDVGFLLSSFDEVTRRAVIALAAELEQRDADAALGALVRRMPELQYPGHALVKLIYSGVFERWKVAFSGPTCVGATPEAALEEALKERDEAE